jgi:uncharacterized protein YndB with AHSA1/START domain
MTGPATKLEFPSDREFQLTRLLDAPRELVWEVWTDPQHIVQWFGPEGFDTTTHAFDFRVGGSWRFTMHGPDGVDYRNKQLFQEIVPRERFVYLHTGGLESEDEGGFIATVTFAAEGRKTRVTLNSRFPTVEAMRHTIETYGAVEGGEQHLGRLARYLTLPRAQKMVILSRMLNAPRTLVWKALTTPEGMTEWFSPRGFTVPRATADLRVGGRWMVVHRGSDGVDWENSGNYLEVSPESRLVFSWIQESAPGTIVVEAHQYLTLIESRGRTRLTFVARIITAGPGSEIFMAGVDQGWSQALDKLAAAF